VSEDIHLLFLPLITSIHVKKREPCILTSSLVSSVAFYGYKTWSPTLKQVHKVSVRREFAKITESSACETAVRFDAIMRDVCCYAFVNFVQVLLKLFYVSRDIGEFSCFIIYDISQQYSRIKQSFLKFVHTRVNRFYASVLLVAHDNYGAASKLGP
jgi:hypothetical protein